MIWTAKGERFETAAVTWVPFTTLLLPAEPEEVFTISIYGEIEGYADFRIDCDGQPTSLFSSIGVHRPGPPIVLSAGFRVPRRNGLTALARIDDPMRVKILARATRLLKISNYTVVIHKAPCG